MNPAIPVPPATARIGWTIFERGTGTILGWVRRSEDDETGKHGAAWILLDDPARGSRRSRLLRQCQTRGTVPVSEDDMTDLEDMMVDRDMTYDEARNVLADASDLDEDRYERHRKRLSDFAEQEREEADSE